MRHAALFRSLPAALGMALALVATAPLHAQAMREGIPDMASPDHISAVPAQIVPPTPRLTFLPDSGSELLTLVENCREETCMSYVFGVIQGTSVYASLAERPSPFCASDEIDGSDIQDAIIDTIRATPQLAEAPAALSVLAAFSRYWPCVSADELDSLRSEALLPADPDLLDELLASGNHALDMGNPFAPAHETIIVFHDHNCGHCRRFRGEAASLVARGWRVIVYPVAVSSSETTGYGAVQIAMRDRAPHVALALYEQDPASIADITLAMKITERLGVSSRDVLEAVAASGAYDAMSRNNEFFFRFGALGTPAWIVSGSLYSGYLGAGAIVALSESMEVGEGEYGSSYEDFDDAMDGWHDPAPETSDPTAAMQTEGGPIDGRPAEEALHDEVGTGEAGQIDATSEALRRALQAAPDVPLEDLETDLDLPDVIPGFEPDPEPQAEPEADTAP